MRRIFGEVENGSEDGVADPRKSTIRLANLGNQLISSGISRQVSSSCGNSTKVASILFAKVDVWAQRGTRRSSAVGPIAASVPPNTTIIPVP